MTDFHWLLRQSPRLRDALATVPGPGWNIYADRFDRVEPYVCKFSDVDAWLPCSELAIAAKAASLFKNAGRYSVGWTEGRFGAIVTVGLSGFDAGYDAKSTHEAACRLLAAALGIAWMEDPDHA